MQNYHGTAEQLENRMHRIAYMIDVDVSEEQAAAYCDSFPEQYGRRVIKEKQEALF